MIDYKRIVPAPAYLTTLMAAVISTVALMPGRTSRDQAASADPTSDVGKAPAVAAIPLSDYRPLAELTADLLDRPLILDGRRIGPVVPVRSETPIAPAESDIVKTEPATAVLAPTLRYMGYLNDGKAPRALLSWGQNSSEAEWYAVGQERDGWRISDIERQRIKISNGVDELIFDLFAE